MHGQATGERMSDGGTSPEVNGTSTPSAAAPPIDEVLTGFHSTNQRVSQAAHKAKEAATYSFAPAELLVRKAVVGVDELELISGRGDLGPPPEDLNEATRFSGRVG